MDAKLKEEWVKALRSGEYRQARYGIGSTRAKCLCCLGVGAYVANGHTFPEIADYIEANL